MKEKGNMEYISQLSSLPLEGHEWFYLGTSVAWTIALLALPVPKWLLRMRLTPNMITIFRVVLFWTGFVLYLKGEFYVGHMLMLTAFLLDKTDGQMARILYADPTKLTAKLLKAKALGEKLDPASDKGTLPVALIILAIVTTVTWWDPLRFNTWLIFAVDMVGSWTRSQRGIRWFERATKRWPALASRRRPEVAANFVGKSKVVGQYFTKLPFLAMYQGVLPSAWLTLFLAIATLALGIWSLLSKWGFGPNVDTYLRTLSKRTKKYVHRLRQIRQELADLRKYLD